MKDYSVLALDTLNQWFLSSGIDTSKLVDFELVNAYLKGCKKSTPKGISISYSPGKSKRLYLRFKTASYPRADRDYPCGETIGKDGLIKALIKAFKVADKLDSLENESSFWEWYKSEIEEVTQIKNDLITTQEAVRTWKQRYFEARDKRGLKRSDDGFESNTEANWDSTYGVFYGKLDEKKICNAQNLIEQFDKTWGHLKGRKGFKNANAAVCKLLRETKQHNEVQKWVEYYGKIEVTEKTEMQEIDINLFLDFRNRVLGLNGYTLSKPQLNNLTGRQEWFKALSINLIYGFRGQEFKAIANLDKPVTIGKRVIPALYDPLNKDNILVLNDYFEVIDDSGKVHKITIKTKGRLARPMIHPDYPNLIEILDVKNPEIKIPSLVPKSSSTARVIKQAHLNRLGVCLSRWINQCGLGFTQTHALRHLANLHGTLSGLTVDQRALSLGHSKAMNEKYDKHKTIDSTLDLLKRDINGINEAKQKIERLEAENAKLKELLAFSQRENMNLKKIIQKLQGVENGE